MEPATELNPGDQCFSKIDVSFLKPLRGDLQ